MERLTLKDFDMCHYCSYGKTCEHYVDNSFPVCEERAIYGRLAAIEDILGDEYDLDELRETIRAKRDGRCVVLPCKVGDTVYRVGASVCKWRDIDKCDEYCDGWQYRDCWEGTRAILEEKFSFSDLESTGKTIFLTRETAEAALKGEQDE